MRDVTKRFEEMRALKQRLAEATKAQGEATARSSGIEMANPFFTIGHSTRTIDEFVDLLNNAKVRLVVDVRTMPRSRTNPQYNSDALAEALSRIPDRIRAYCGARRPARTEAGRAGGT